MKNHLRAIVLILAFVAIVTTSEGKDAPLTLRACPAPVQAVIQQYSAKWKFESVALDEKKKSHGEPVYEAKFVMPDGKRIELHISPAGQLITTEEKKPKT